MVSGPVYIAVMLFGMSPWLAIIGVLVELPLMVNALPEYWNLPSYLIITIQSANLGPAAYAVWDKMRQRSQQARDGQQHQQQQHSHIDTDVVMSLIIIVMVIMSMALLSLFWDHTAVVASVNRSVALLTLVFFASLACCTSAVVFLPYMARFPPVYISAFYLGQGLSGLVPGLLGLAQVAEEQPRCRNETVVNNDTVTVNVLNATTASNAYDKSPRFSVSLFFALITVLLCVSAAAFCSLSFVQKCRSEMIVDADDDGTRRLLDADEAQETAGNLETPVNADSDLVQSGHNVTDVAPQRRRYISLLVTVFIISALWYGIQPSTQSYTCLPYGNIVYELSISLSWVVSPLATLPDMVVPTSSLPLITGLGTVSCLIAALQLFLAAQSPHPILQGSVIGQVIVVRYFYRPGCVKQ